MLKFLQTAFAVILMPMAFPIVTKVGFNFRAIMYITIFVSHIRKAALNMWSVVKTYLKVLRSSCFHAIVGRRTSSPERFEDLVLLDFPFWGHLNFSFYFKTQSSNLAHYAPWLPALFKRTILRRRTPFLGPLKSSKKYAQKVHSDWFICPQEQ